MHVRSLGFGDENMPAGWSAVNHTVVLSCCRYRDDRQVMSVAAKLKKFHTVMQECGNMRLGLQDILVKPGQTLSQFMEQDAKQIEGLTAAAAAARAKAVAVIVGLPVTTQLQEDKSQHGEGIAAGGVQKGFLGKSRTTVSSEIEVDDSSALNASGMCLYVMISLGVMS